jgi:hypothetical protein
VLERTAAISYSHAVAPAVAAAPGLTDQ